MIASFADTLRKSAVVLGESFSSFRRNNGLAMASSLAFFAMLAVIPALFLLTTLLGVTIGSSQEAFQRVQNLATQVIPAYSQEFLREVRTISAHRGAFGTLNFVVFVLAVTPLVAQLRASLRAVFRSSPGRPFVLEKLLDLAITVILLLGITAVAALGIALTVVRQRISLPALPPYLGWFMQYLFTAASVFLLYSLFSRRYRVLHLAAGALTAAGLWFALRPLFHLFLAYNPGYGFAFGSFKSLFVAVIWIYYSLVVFLAGAEIAAGLEQREMTYLKRLVAGMAGLPAAVARRFIVRCEKGELLFAAGDPADRMFLVLRGSVALRKGEREFARVSAGQYVGVVSFLLESPRLADAAAEEDAELVQLDRRNIADLIHEAPELVVGMMKEIAFRLRDTGNPPE